MQRKQRKDPTSLSDSGLSRAKPISMETSRHLSSIDRLLSSAYEIMKQEPAVDSSVVEQFRQVRVRIRYALAAAEDPVRGPKTAPSLWKDRVDRNENPIIFTKRIYSEWIGKNLSRADIKRLDKQLYAAIYNMENPSEKLGEIGLLTKRQVNDLKLSKTGKLKRPTKTKKTSEMSQEDRENARLFYVARSRNRSKPQ
jgi:hypothetical protein